MTVIEKIKNNGDIAIPLAVLKKLKLKPGAEIILHTEQNSLIVERPLQSIKHIKRLRGMWKDVDIETPIRNLRKRWSEWKKTHSA